MRQVELRNEKGHQKRRRKQEQRADHHRHAPHRLYPEGDGIIYQQRKQQKYQQIGVETVYGAGQEKLHAGYAVDAHRHEKYIVYNSDENAAETSGQRICALQHALPGMTPEQQIGGDEQQEGEKRAESLEYQRAGAVEIGGAFGKDGKDVQKGTGQDQRGHFERADGFGAVNGEDLPSNFSVAQLGAGDILYAQIFSAESAPRCAEKHVAPEV